MSNPDSDRTCILCKHFDVALAETCEGYAVG